MRRQAFRKGIWAGLLILFLLSSCDQAQQPEQGELEARLEGLIAKIEKLQEENEKLYAERRRLEAQLQALEGAEWQISERLKGQLDALLKENQKLQEEVAKLTAQNRGLTQKTQELEASLTQLEERLSQSLQENAELRERLEEESKLEETKLRHRLIQLREELLGRRLQRLLQAQSPSEKAQETVTKMEEAIQASRWGSYSQAIALHEELLQTQPDLSVAVPQLRYPITTEYLEWEVLNLRQLAGEPWEKLIETWEAYITEHPYSPFTDDVLVRLIDAYSNGLSWSEGALFDPARAIVHLKRLWDLAWQGELECEPMLFQEWNGEEACSLQTLYSFYDSSDFEAAFGYYLKRDEGRIALALGQGYELQGDCSAALSWYERALLSLRGPERQQLLLKVVLLKGSCPGS